MSRANVRIALLGWAAGLLAVVPLLAQDGFYTQRFDLQPGWNAIFVEVRPEPAGIDEVFAGVPVESVWGWFPPMGEVDFIQDPNEGLLQIESWRGYFPPGTPEAVLSNLFALEPNRAYLVKLLGDAPRTVTVTGRPVTLPLEWTPDSFNLVGFAVDPLLSPTFGGFLEPSPAHDGQPVYRLDPAGEWRLVDQPFSATIRAGEAYWVFTEGPSSYQGPLEVDPGSFDGLEYSAALHILPLTVRNRSLSEANIRLRPLQSSAPVPLTVREIDDETGATRYPDLPAVHEVATVPGQETSVVLGVKRRDLAADRAEQILEITDGLGSRRLVFIGATRVQPAAPLPSSRGRLATKTGADPFAGLWVGQTMVTAVSEAQLAGTEPTPTGDPFRFRLLIHVDAGGQARLLKQVIQMWQDGTQVPDPETGLLVVDEPGRYVLVTDDARIPDFTGATLRDGVPVGLRISTVAYDFPDDELALSGTFDPAGSLAVDWTLDADHPTNPFKHRYHPDHDNLDAQFLNPLDEAFDVTRRLTLDFSSEHPTGREPPEWGDSAVGGTYREEIEGLHKNPIFVEGVFLLERVAATAELNP